MISMWVIIGAGVIVGGVLGVYSGMKKKNDTTEIDSNQSAKAAVPEDSRYSWEVLMKSQKSLDELRIADVLEWVNGCKSTLKEGDNLFLFKATKSNITKIGYKYPEQVDSDTNMIACVINTESGDVTNVQLFTFGIISEKVDKLFAGCDYAVITLK